MKVLTDLVVFQAIEGEDWWWRRWSGRWRSRSKVMWVQQWFRDWVPGLGWVPGLPAYIIIITWHCLPQKLSRTIREGKISFRKISEQHLNKAIEGWGFNHSQSNNKAIWRWVTALMQEIHQLWPSSNDSCQSRYKDACGCDRVESKWRILGGPVPPLVSTPKCNVGFIGANRNEPLDQS